MRIIVINRWIDEFAQYHNYIDHEKHQVAYIATNESKKWLSPHSQIIIQDDLNNFDLLYENVNTLVNSLNGIDLLIAMSEPDLINAAKLREIYNVQGLKLKDTEILKDKIIMKSYVEQHNILTPPFIDCLNKEKIKEFLQLIGYPAILKPKREASSRGVFKVTSEKELNTILSKIPLDQYECEKYIEGDIYHVDGVILNDNLIFIKASKYINSCLDFKNGQAVGSVVSDNKSLNKKIFAISKKILSALNLSSGIFHLELIVKNNDIYFLEIGARMGGGESNVIIRDIFGVNLAECWVKIQLNEPLPEITQINTEYGGLLLFPEPSNIPCSVIAVSSFINKVPCIYKEVLPSIGEILDGKGGYDHISGKFLLKGKNSISIENAIRKIMANFYIKTKEVTI